MKKTETATYHIIQKDWRWSPEVWKSMAACLFYGFVIGLISMAVYSAKHSKPETPAPTVTVTVTSAP